MFSIRVPLHRCASPRPQRSFTSEWIHQPGSLVLPALEAKTLAGSMFPHQDVRQSVLLDRDQAQAMNSPVLPSLLVQSSVEAKPIIPGFLDERTLDFGNATKGAPQLQPDADIIGVVPFFDPTRSSPSTVVSLALHHGSTATSTFPFIGGLGVVNLSVSSTSYPLNSSSQDHLTQEDGNTSGGSGGPVFPSSLVVGDDESLVVNRTGPGPSTDGYLTVSGPPTGTETQVFDLDSYDFTTHTNLGLVQSPVSYSGTFQLGFSPATAPASSSMGFSLVADGISVTFAGGTGFGTINIAYQSGGTGHVYNNTSFTGSVTIPFDASNVSETMNSVQYSSFNDISLPQGTTPVSGQDSLSWKYTATY